MITEELILNATRNYKGGFYKEAIIFAQTAIETFVKNLLVFFLEHEGEDKNTSIEDIPFMKMIKSEMSKRLGGRWDITKKNSVLERWYTCTYCLRNKIAHSGYMPEFKEVRDAIGYAEKMLKYIIKLVYSKSEYSELKKYFYTKE